MQPDIMVCFQWKEYKNIAILNDKQMINKAN